jgi:hypothetical protein
MFFLISSFDGFDLQYLESLQHIPGDWQWVQYGSVTIAWLETRFTKVDRFTDRIVITTKRPDDTEAICSLELRFAPIRVMAKRRWSGDFCLYVAKEPDLIITSDLKLAVLVCRKMPKGIRSVCPGSSLDIRGSRCDRLKINPAPKLNSPYRKTYSETVCAVRQLIYDSVRAMPDSAALLLSGGLDSAILAAVARVYQGFIY